MSGAADAFRDLVVRVNERLTYKDWTLELKTVDRPFTYMGGPQVELSWSHPVVDRHTGKPSTAAGRRLVSLPAPFGLDDLTEKVLVAAIWSAVIGAETHEAMEQFQLGGVSVYDPHPGREFEMSPKLFEPDLSGLYTTEAPAE